MAVLVSWAHSLVLDAAVQANSPWINYITEDDQAICDTKCKIWRVVDSSQTLSSKQETLDRCDTSAACLSACLRGCDRKRMCVGENGATDAEKTCGQIAHLLGQMET